MRVSEAAVDSLAGSGIDVAFGIPGKQTLPLNGAIADRDDMAFVVARHETAVSHAAWGYAETTGRPAATVTVPGPGDMNAMNGLKNALNDCTPLVHVAVETDPQVRGGEGIHETPPDTYDNVVKANVLVETPESTVAELERAVAVAETPPKGPVRVGIPKGFLRMDVPLAAAGPYERPSPGPVPEAAIERAGEVLAGAEVPVIVAGGGVRSADASGPLRRVAELLGAPLVTTYKGKGVVADDHPLVAGTLAGSASPELLDLVAGADAALGVGTDFDAVSTRAWSVEVPDDLVHVTLHPDDIGTGYDPAVGIVGDAAATLDSLGADLEGRDVASSDGRTRVQHVRERLTERLDPLRTETAPFTSVAVLERLRAVLPRETIVTADAGGFRVWGLNVFEASGPRSYVNPGSWATMGTALPSAIGAQVGNPDTPVVALVGDGGLLMALHELHTAVAESVPVTVVVFNNDDYAIISEEAERSYGFEPPAYGWNGDSIDFPSVAEGMGMAAEQVRTLDRLDEVVGEAVRSSEPTLVEVPTDPDEPQASEWLSK
jgi:acetolactate synthase-1/2/3 large subunit